MVSRTLVLLLLLVLPARVAAIDNGLGLLPPLAWRSWNAFHENFNQTTIMDMVDALVMKRPPAGLSLQDLGYNLIGIDEGACADGAGYGSFFGRVWREWRSPSPLNTPVQQPRCGSAASDCACTDLLSLRLTSLLC
eukprot:SAG22_NODE_63_length_23302_cov_17.506551_5_plen_136_part_00